MSAEKIKIVHVVPLLDHGGIETTRLLMGKYGQVSDTEVLFVALGRGGEVAKALQGLGQRVLCLGSSSTRPGWKLVRRLKKLFEEERPEVVHACAPDANFHSVLACQLAGVPVCLCEEPGMGERSWLAHKILGAVYAMSDGVVCISNAVQKHVRNSSWPWRFRTEVVYQPCDAEKFFIHLDGAVEKKAGRFVVMTHCRLVREKNLEYLIEAAAPFLRRHQEAELWIAGEGPLKRSLESQVGRACIESQVKFLGHQSNPQPYLAEADCYVITSSSEGLSVSLIEAMACGLPAIATRVGGIPEVLPEQHHGDWLVSLGNASELEKKIEMAFLMGGSERKKVGEINCKRASEVFSPVIYVRRLMELYKKILRENI